MESRFILCGVVNGTDKVSDFRLIRSPKKYSGGHCIRINIPKDMSLLSCPGDGYSTVYDHKDKRTLNDVGWDCYFVYNGKWKKFNYLKKFQPHEWYCVLEYIFSLYKCSDGSIGWTDNKNQYIEDIEGDELREIYPNFKEDKKELNLPLKLKEYPFEYCNDDWYKIYLELREKYVCGA